MNNRSNDRFSRSVVIDGLVSAGTSRMVSVRFAIRKMEKICILLSEVIEKTPAAAQLTVKSGAAETLLPRTTYEFEQGEKLAKIKAIRGLTPKKDVKIQMSNTFSAVSIQRFNMND